jgi:hypothetical protein
MRKRLDLADAESGLFCFGAREAEDAGHQKIVYARR